METAGPPVGGIIAVILLMGVLVFLVVFVVLRNRKPPRLVPPGWYPDPWGQAAHRYWDGSTWTGHTA